MSDQVTVTLPRAIAKLAGETLADVAEIESPTLATQLTVAADKINHAIGSIPPMDTDIHNARQQAMGPNGTLQTLKEEVE